MDLGVENIRVVHTSSVTIRQECMQLWRIKWEGAYRGYSSAAAFSTLSAKVAIRQERIPWRIKLEGACRGCHILIIIDSQIPTMLQDKLKT